MEMQRGVVGDLSRLPALAEAAAKHGLVEALARLLRAARSAGLGVVHCTAAFRADRAGSHRNVPMLERLLEDPDHMLTGSPQVEILQELGPAAGDRISQRFHGVSPFTHTDLEATLRTMGTRTIVATGVSLNVGVLGLAIEAVNHGYHVVIPKECVVGVPLDYGEQMLHRSLSVIATLCSSDDLIAAWQPGSSR
ncbi:MAG: cysteine hydrolase [Deltaproteobacteria bacterium]|nr:cysteine hydrolase [Deltaproteobacteria bacterium]MBW2697601.1 cysteine hydrolase [Deltaproteobacteria bacterium]